MIRRLLCWLGFHEWFDGCDLCRERGQCDDCYNCEFGHGKNICCKCCGKVKK